MLRTEIRLTLSNWPINPIPQNRFRLSPNTARTLRESNISAQVILPISLAQFRLTNNLLQLGNSEVIQMYETDKKRRRKKAQILKTLWEKIVKKREKKRNLSSIKNSKVQRGLETLSDRHVSHHFQKDRKSSQKSHSPLIFKAKSPKNNVAYSDYYSLANKQQKSSKRIHTEDESTRSRQKNSYTRNGEYYQNSAQKKRNTPKSPSFKDTIILMMNDVMKRWSDLDQKHFNELGELKNVSEEEKRRLLKIHKIEKQKLRLQLENVKSNLTANRKLSKHFL